MMSTAIQVVIDCSDPARIAGFWADALGYEIPGPPDGHATWPEFLATIGVPESEWNSASAVEDPAGAGPRLFFQQVPEPKERKNRLHLDLRISGGPQTPEGERNRRLRDEVQRLVALGAARVREVRERGEFWVVMTDPEGNEFCVT